MSSKDSESGAGKGTRSAPAYPTELADRDGEPARIDAKMSEPGRMEALQAMTETDPGDAGAQLPNVGCPFLAGTAVRA